ncbi:MAG: alkaline phosphatase family protein [Calditrichaeota bacterium]|nr:alkaline phosphatase family protein [Calditrichota bacterium]
MKTLNRFLIIAALFVCTILHAQTAPPLTVIVVIDQLPITLITENMDLFSEDGFKRLDRDGVFYTECRYRHGVLETGPGHATIATGCDPKTHGIVGNSWRNPDGSEEYCVQCDSSILLVSEVGGVAMGSSNCPDNIMVDGLSDAWRGKFGADAKIWSMSLKDRAAIAMGGKSPTGVLWSNKGGPFESSTYYFGGLPSWCRISNEDFWFYDFAWQAFKESRDFKVSDIEFSSADDMAGQAKPNTFPIELPSNDSLLLRGYGASLKASPIGNRWLYGVAKTCITEEKLGEDDTPDLLWISFSSNDMCGHIYGPLSQEILDITLRTDKLIAEMLKFLDETVGKGNYFFALTADHGVCPPFESPKIPEGVGGRFSFKQMKADLNQELQSEFDAEAHTSGEFVAELGIPDVGFDRSVIRQAHLDLRHTATRAIDWLRTQPGIDNVVLTMTAEDVQAIADSTLRSHVANNYFPGRSSDAYLRPLMYWQSDGSTANHGSCNEYDLHVPLFIMGAPFGHGRSTKTCAPEDLVPTLADALDLRFAVPRDGRSLLPR